MLIIIVTCGNTKAPSPLPEVASDIAIPLLFEKYSPITTKEGL